RDERTGRHRTRRVEKPGPTGLLTTSTRSLRTQLGTRHLEVPIPDDTQQTRAVMRVQAQASAGLGSAPPDLAPFVALQRWLALAGAPPGVVPFAPVLPAFVPGGGVPLRRDLPHVLAARSA